jgi:tetratricopeptide (TPR) repeat protein
VVTSSIWAMPSSSGGEEVTADVSYIMASGAAQLFRLLESCAGVLLSRKVCRYSEGLSLANTLACADISAVNSDNPDVFEASMDGRPIWAARWPWLLTQVALTHYDSGHYSGAARVFASTRAIAPWRLVGVATFSSVLWHLRKPVDAAHLAHQALSISRTDAESWMAGANALSQQQEHDSACRQLRRALQLDPFNSYACVLLGQEILASLASQQVHHTENSQMAGAFACFRHALKLSCNTSYHAWYGLGAGYARIGDFELAEFHLRKALQLQPRNSVLVHLLGTTLRSQVVPAETAVGAFEPDAKSRTVLKEALDFFDAAVSFDKRNFVAQFERAVTLTHMDKLDEAEKQLESLRALVPREPAVHSLLGDICRIRAKRATTSVEEFNEPTIESVRRYVADGITHYTAVQELEGSTASDHNGVGAHINELVNRELDMEKALAFEEE